MSPDSGSNANDSRQARDLFHIRILPAGRNDKVVEVSDLGGNVLKYLHIRYQLGNSVEQREVEQVKRDWENLKADEFARKYGISLESGS